MYAAGWPMAAGHSGLLGWMSQERGKAAVCAECPMSGRVCLGGLVDDWMCREMDTMELGVLRAL
jgi:hypothetical protein